MKKYIAIAGVVIFLLIAFAILISFMLGGSESVTLGFGKKVAVIPIKGEIIADAGEFVPFFTADEIVEKLDDANEDNSVGAILLDIDSPGGEVIATKQIVYKLRNISKPKVAWIASIGTSGAYYVASASDFIISDPDSITGSIGVIMQSPHLSTLLSNLGIDMNTVKSGEMKDIANPFEKFRESDKEFLQQLLNDVHENFKKDVLNFRAGKINMGKVNEITDGRIFSGAQAKQLGLIDSLGTRDDAIQKAATLAGIPGKPELKTYEKEQLSFLDLFREAGSSFGSGFKSSLSSAVSRPAIEYK